MDNTNQDSKAVNGVATDDKIESQQQANNGASSETATNVAQMNPEATVTPTTSPAPTASAAPEVKTTQNATVDMAKQAESAVNQGVGQVQQAGKESVEKIGNVVGQVLQPQKSAANQPPVNKDEKVYAAISYIPFVALISIIVKPDSAFVRLHAKQGLLLAMIFFFVGLIAAIVSLFGVVGQFLAFLLGLVPMGALIVDVYSMYLSFTGYWWKIPVLGTVADVIPVEWMAKTSKSNITGQVGVAKEDYDVRQDAIKKETQEAQAPQPTVVTPDSNTNQTVTPTAEKTATEVKDSAVPPPDNAGTETPKQ